MQTVANPTQTDDARRAYLRNALEVILSDDWGQDTERLAQQAQEQDEESREQPHE